MSKSKTRYKVWLEVEEVRNEGTAFEQYQTLDLPFASTASFDTLEEAEGFARRVHEAFSGEAVADDVWEFRVKPEQAGFVSYTVPGHVLQEVLVKDKAPRCKHCGTPFTSDDLCFDCQ